jgi:hypothetical protein
LLEALRANETPKSFLGGADVLVPRAFCAVGVILCYATAGRDGEGSGLGGGVGEVVFSGGGLFAVFALGLCRLVCKIERERRDTDLISSAAS